jgi:hypothetical protein
MSLHLNQLIPTDLWFLYGAIMEGKTHSYNRETSIVDVEGIEIPYDESRVNIFIDEVEQERNRLLLEYQQQPDSTITELDPNLTMVIDSIIDILNIIKDRISWLP